MDLDLLVVAPEDSAEAAALTAVPGLAVQRCATLDAATRQLATQPVDVILLLPPVDVMAVQDWLRQLREAHPRITVAALADESLTPLLRSSVALLPPDRAAWERLLTLWRAPSDWPQQLGPFFLDLASMLFTEFDLDSLLQRIVEQAVQLIPTAEAGSLLLLEGEGFTFKGLVGYSSHLKEVHLPADHYFVPALARGEVVRVHEISHQDRELLPADVGAALREHGRTQEIFETLAAPFVVNGQLLGYLTVDTFGRRVFDEAAEEVLRLFASLASIAIYNARLFQAERRARLLSEALRDVSATLTGTLDTTEILNRLLEALFTLIPACDAADILIVKGDAVCFQHRRARPHFNIESPSQDFCMPLEAVANLSEAATERRPVFVHDTHTYPQWYAAEVSAWIRSNLTVPVFVEDQLTAFLCVLSAAPHVFVAQDGEIMAALAPMAAAAWRNAQFFEHERQARAFAETLQGIGTLLTQTLSEEQIIATVAEQIPRLISCEGLLISLIQEGNLVISPYVQGVSPHNERLLRAGVPLDTFPIWQQVSNEGVGLLIANTALEPRWKDLGEPGEYSVLIAPLQTRRSVVGFLTVLVRRAGAYHQEHLRALQSLADLLVVALSNARLYAHTQRRAEDLEALRRLAVEIGTLQDPAAIVQGAVNLAREMSGAAGASFSRYQLELGALVQMESAGIVAPFRGYQVLPGIGAGGRAWQQQKIISVPNYAQWEERVDYPIAPHIHALISLPVTWQDERIGVLTILLQEANRTFSHNQIRVLQLMAQQLAASLYRANLYQALRRDRDRLAALAAIDQQIIALQDNASEILPLILDYAMKLLMVPKGLILLMREVVSGQTHAFCSQGITDAADAEQLLVANWPLERARHLESGSQGYLAYADVEGMDVKAVHWALQQGVRAVLNCPLWLQGELTGVLVLFDTQPRRWDAEVIELVQMLARQTSIALEKVLLTQELRLSLSEAQVLNQVLQLVNTTLDPKEILRLTCQTVRQALQVPVAVASLLRAYAPTEPAAAPAQRYTWILQEPAVNRQALLQAQLAEPHTLVVNDLAQELPELAAQLPPPPVGGLLVVPLLARGELIGVLSAESPEPRTFTQREIVLLESIAVAMTPALENARLYQEAQEARLRTEEAYHHLQKLDNLKSQFVQNVSHELRTPLAIVKGYVDLALDDSFGFSMDPQLAQAMGAIQTHTNHLVELVEAITSLEDVEMEGLQLRPQPLLPVILTALQAVRQKALRHTLRLHIDLPAQLPVVNLDPQRLGQAFGHLLDNAVKFNKPGGDIWVRGWTKNGKVWVQIADSGIGLREKELAQLFQRFYQVDGTSSRKYGGMGLGLSIVKEVVERHGGRVRAESPGLDQGSAFTVVLPEYRE